MTTINLRTTRNVSVTILFLVLASAMLSPVAQAAVSNPTYANQNQNQSHTLEIIHVNGSVSYQLTSSGKISFAQAHAEDTDNIAGNTASGDVGGLPWEANSNDSKDVIRFTGDVLDLELNDRNGKVRVKLDGKRVNPDSLQNTPTPSSTPSATETTTPPATDSPASTLSPTSTSPTGSTSSASDDGGFGSSLSLSFVLAIAGIGVLLLLRKVE